MKTLAENQSSSLAGVKVVELGTLIAGPYAAGLLAQFGADVIKVESPTDGDPLRKWRKLHNGTSLWWYSQSRNKKSLTLNLKSEAGQQIVRDLVKDADIVIENFRPGTLESWGLGWDALSAINPNLIMVRVSGYGQDGPYHKRPGFAAIAESMGGLRNLIGFPDRPPVRVGVSIGDTLASLYGVIGALMAMHHLKCNGGQGQFIDIALYEAVFGVMESLIPEYARFGLVRERVGASLPGISPSSTYLCKDGKYVIIAGNSDSIFKRLMKAMGRDDLGNNPDLARNDGRVQQNDMIDAAITNWTTSLPIEEVLAALEVAEVPSSGVFTAKDIYEDPHYRARNMIEEHALPDGQRIDLPGVVPKLSATPGKTKWVGPQLGEHTEEILLALGRDAAEIVRLRDSGVI
ncbi:CaiB/BaiF CoA transferase family protein [Herbaspirillum autotrophicum]|uniref:CaiB/BaiF CoA transferase family protein n=1 Tax=Herbaspirillum autotrophicum TaxID=180195 RepID=UPI00067CCD5E|nr:CaiB/BaiF CoA-transferase family protein [Herbaspirillum autotrophicum]